MYTTKFIFEEKNLLSEMLGDEYFQILKNKDTVYVLTMSELKLDFNEKIEYSISRDDGTISFFNKGNDIDKLTEVSFYELLDDTAEATGSIINYELEDEDINELIKLFKNAKEIKLLNFNVTDFEAIEELMEDTAFQLADGFDILNELQNEEPKYGISNKNNNSIKKITYDICLDNGWITPFNFIKDVNELRDYKNIKMPSYIKESNITTLK